MSVSYHRFTNLREIIQRDLSRKLTVGLTSQDFVPLPCNCRAALIGTHGYNNMSRNSIAVYKVQFSNAGKVHIGSTQQSSKLECNNISMKSKSLSILTRNRIYATKTLQVNSMTQINPKSTTMKEQFAASSDKETQHLQSKLLLLKTAPCVLKRELQFLNNPDPTHTSNNEIYGACGHRPCFHRCQEPMNQSMTKSQPNTHYKVTPHFTRCNVCLADV